MRFKIPPPDVPPVYFDQDTKQFKWTSDYYDFFKNLERLRLVDLADVPTTTPVDGQILAYSATTGSWSLEPATPQANLQVLIWDSTLKQWKAAAN